MQFLIKLVLSVENGLKVTPKKKSRLIIQLVVKLLEKFLNALLLRHKKLFKKRNLLFLHGEIKPPKKDQ